jgi:hypothetical protein
MRSFRLGFLSAAAVLFGFALAPHQAARADVEATTDAMSGVWDVTVTPDSAAVQAGKETFGDEVLFEDGHFTASACAKYGFAPADYTLTGSTFVSTLSGDEGTIVWSGTLTSNAFTGSVVWTKPDGHVYTYTLHGQRHVQDELSESGS